MAARVGSPSGLGWPDCSQSSFPSSQPSGLGWPGQPMPAAGTEVCAEGISATPGATSPGAASSDGTVSLVTSDTVSRETEPLSVPSAGAGDPSAAAATIAAQPAATAAPTVGYRTAQEVARTAIGSDDASTPLAREVRQQLLAREGRAAGQPLPRPARTRVMVVANQKGGVGKTTSAVNLAVALAQHGQHVLVVDLDPQGNASTALGIDHRRGTPSTYEALVAGIDVADVVQKSPEMDGLLVMPATIDLAGAEIELVSMVARENRLRRALRGYPPLTSDGDDRLDYVLIDCPPSLGLLTLNALVAAEEMLIPIQAEYYALEGLGQLMETVAMVRAHLNPELDVSTILLTMYDARTRLAAGVADEVRTHFGPQVLGTAIPRSVRISEAPSYGRTVMTYDPASPGALSYLEAAREMAIKGARQ
jgi:chromosome partitioning protein